MLKRATNHKKEVLFRDPATEVVYRRVAGAVGWPWEPAPGYLVVIGERYAIDPGLRGRRLEVLAEREAAGIEDIYRGVLELRRLWCCDIWLADMGQEEAVRLFRRASRDDQRLKGWEPVWLRTAPYSQGDNRLHTLFQMLGMVQSPERKLLTYGPESRLPGLAMGLDPKDLKQPAGQFPALAALGYAVTEMLLREPWEKGREPKVVNSWDIYQAR